MRVSGPDKIHSRSPRKLSAIACRSLCHNPLPRTFFFLAKFCSCFPWRMPFLEARALVVHTLFFFFFLIPLSSDEQEFRIPRGLLECGSFLSIPFRFSSFPLSRFPICFAVRLHACRGCLGNGKSHHLRTTVVHCNGGSQLRPKISQLRPGQWV